jgi:hypothetical protein
MNAESQRTLAVWVFYIVSFLLLAAFLHLQARLTIGVIGLYWGSAVVLTSIGVIPPPWDPFV